MIGKFFEKIAGCLYKENDLSDFTWSLCEISPDFKLWFLKYFFNDFDAKENDIIMIREYSSGKSRVDFYIVAAKVEFIIEVKIYDQNHHFDQYITDYPDANRGYIAAYPLPEIEGYSVRQWSDFYFHLEKLMMSHTNDKPDYPVILGYMQYLKNVCSIHKLQKMKFDNLQSLFEFNKLIEETILSYPHLKTSLWRMATSFDETRFGWYFNVSKKDVKSSICPWIGIYFQEYTAIYLEISESSCRSVYEWLYPKLRKQKFDLHFWDQPYNDDSYNYNSICFELKEEHFGHFNDCEATVEKQQQLFREYLLELLNLFEPHFPQDNPNPI